VRMLSLFGSDHRVRAVTRCLASRAAARAAGRHELMGLMRGLKVRTGFERLVQLEPLRIDQAALDPAVPSAIKEIGVRTTFLLMDGNKQDAGGVGLADTL